MSDNLEKTISKYTYFLGELRTSQITVVSEMSKLLFKNLDYLKTNDLTVEQCFSETPELEFINNDDTPQDYRSFNYIREKLYNLYKESLGE